MQYVSGVPKQINSTAEVIMINWNVTYNFKKSNKPNRRINKCLLRGKEH